MKTVIACLLLSSCAASVFAQTDEPYVVPHKGPKLICPAGKRLGWNNTSSVWQETEVDRADKLTKQGEVAFNMGDIAAAGVYFKDAIDHEQIWGNAYMGLAKVYTAQGHITKAIEAYRTVFYDLSLWGIDDPEKEAYRQKIFRDPVGARQYVGDGLRYAILLNRTGQWAEAVTVYKSALQGVPGGDLPKLDFSFDASDPNPVALEAAARMALGLVLNFGNGDEKNIDAMKEYASALQLEPDWALTNYYYHFGWQQLSPPERVKFGTAQQAKAALQKAAVSEDDNIKKAAEEAMKRMP